MIKYIDGDYMEIINNKIKDANTALQLLQNYLLISKTYGYDSCLYALSKNNILVINSTRKYYISKEDFLNDFHLSDYYIYKPLSEIEINQEFKKLRQ